MTVSKSFTERRQAALKSEDDQKDKERLLKLLRHATASEKDIIWEAMKNGDRESYMEAIKPVVYRMTIKEFNIKGASQWSNTTN